MKKFIIIAILGINSLAFAGEMTITERLEAAKKKQQELSAEIIRLEKPSARETSFDLLVQVKRRYEECSAKVVNMTKELVEKIKKGDK
jgi:hypothetical protein